MLLASRTFASPARSNLTMITFPVEDNVILVTTNKSTSPITLARKIVLIIDDHGKQF